MAKCKTITIKLLDLTTGKWDRRLSQSAALKLIKVTASGKQLLPVGDHRKAKRRFKFVRPKTVGELAKRTGKERVGYLRSVKVIYGEDGLIDKVFANLRIDRQWLLNNDGPDPNCKLKHRPIMEVTGCIIRKIYGIDVRFVKVKPAESGVGQLDTLLEIADALNANPN